MASQRSCKYTKPGGEKCRAYPLKGSEYCFFHDPRRARERGEACSRGGKTSTGNPAVLPSSEFKLQELANIVTLMEETINHVLTGELEVRIAQCTGYLAGVAIKALEGADLERRVEALEQIISKRSV